MTRVRVLTAEILLRTAEMPAWKEELAKIKR